MSVCLCVCYSLSGVWLLVTPWTAAHQAPLSMEFPLQEYWSGLPFTSPGEFSNPAIDPRSPTNHLSHQGSPRNKGKEFNNHTKHKCIKFVWRTENYMILVFSLCVCIYIYTSVVSDSVWSHRRQLIRLPRPGDSPGKNTGVGCHFLLQCVKVKSESEVAQSCPTLSNPMDHSPPSSSIHGIFQARVLEWGAIALSTCIYTVY